MIKRLIWTIWTPMSSVLKKADKLNLSLSLSDQHQAITWTNVEILLMTISSAILPHPGVNRKVSIDHSTFIKPLDIWLCQAISYISVDQVPWQHMAYLGLNESWRNRISDLLELQKCWNHQSLLCLQWCKEGSRQALLAEGRWFRPCEFLRSPSKILKKFGPQNCIAQICFHGLLYFDVCIHQWTGSSYVIIIRYWLALCVSSHRYLNQCWRNVD